MAFGIEKIEWLDNPVVKKLKICLFVLTDRRIQTETDRQTDRRTPHDGTGRAYA